MLFGKKKNKSGIEEVPTKKEMSSGVLREIEEYLAQMKAEQVLSLDELSGVAGGAPLTLAALTSDIKKEQEAFENLVRQKKGAGASLIQTTSEIINTMQQKDPDTINAVYNKVSSIWSRIL